MLLLVTLLLFTGIIAEPIPEDELTDFLRDVYESVHQNLSKPRSIPPVSRVGSFSLFGMNIEFSYDIEESTIVGPMGIESMGLVKGEKLPSGNLFVETEILLGKMEVSYGSVSVEVMGHKWNGPVKLTTHGTTAELTLRLVKKHLLQPCYRTIATITSPKVLYLIKIGNPGSVIYYLSNIIAPALDFISMKFTKTTSLASYIQSLVFPDIQKTLSEGFNEYKAFCST